jgi:hypothetical protein
MADIHYLDQPLETEALLERLCPPVRNWFKDTFPDFTRPQKLAIPAIIDQEHLLLCSPTGSGKTLTAFLTIIDQLVRRALDGKARQKESIASTSHQSRPSQMTFKGTCLDRSRKSQSATCLTVHKKSKLGCEQVTHLKANGRKCYGTLRISSSQRRKAWPLPSLRHGSSQL